MDLAPTISAIRRNCRTLSNDPPRLDRLQGSWSSLAKAHGIAAADDDVIEDLDFDQIENLLQLPGDVEVGL
jgi:hypothetical protein